MATDREALLLQVSADVSKLQKQFEKAQGIVNTGSRNMEKRAQQASTSLERFFGKTDIAKGVDKIFDSSRLRIFDTATARIGLTGSALESLGPLGLAAAAGVGALAAAFVGARDAARFADDIEATANRLHITTDALQAYRYAIRAAGGEEKGADEAFAAFSETLGKASEGLPKVLRGFKALFGKEFTAQSVKGLGSVEEAMATVQKRLQGLSNIQKDAIISQFGLTGLKDLLEGSTERMQQLLGDAKKLGLVMDTGLVKRGRELNEQFETVTKVIDVQLKSALVDLSPVLVGILQKMADLAKKAAEVADSFRDIQHKSDAGLAADLAAAEKGRQSFIGRNITSGAMDKMIADLKAEQARREKEAATEAARRGGVTRGLTDQTPVPRDDTAQRTDTVNVAVAGAAKDLLQAQGRLTDDIEARAEIERKIADQELAQALARLEKEKADIQDDKGISAATKATLSARLDQAEAVARQAAQAKQELIARDAAFAIEDRQIDVYKATVEAQLSQLQVEADIATTAAQRAEIEKRILDLRQQLERDLAGTSLDRQLKTGAINQEQHDRQVAALNRTQAAGQAQFAADHLQPLQQYLRGIQDLNTEFQTAGVQAIQTLSDGLADAIVNAKNLGDVAGNVFKQLLAQILSATLQKNLFGPILGALHLAAPVPAFASGTGFAPGGLSLVGEQGPELVNLPRGAQVIPSNVLRALSDLSVPQRPSVNVVQPISFDLRGSVMTDDLLRQMQEIGARSAMMGAQGGSKLAQMDLRRRQRRAL